mgnify:CR=1 FL=1|jgi:hypothetical protein
MAPRKDLRARLSPRGSVVTNQNGFGTVRSNYTVPFEGPGAALRTTNGIIFPFTPNINVAHSVEYSQYDLVHTNYQQNAYSRTRNPAIQISGVFASQTPDEVAYTVGVMHFLRVMSKMNFGTGDEDRGTPPPVCEFNAYGTYNFNRVPVLIGDFAFNYEDGVDYVEAVVNGETVQIPAVMTISISLLPQYSAAKQNNFNLGEFAQGTGYKRGFL